MMSSLNLNSVLENLETTQVDKQVPALEQAAEIVNSVAIKAVEALRKGPNRFLVAERLKCLGSVIVPHLEKLLNESDDSETRILAAVVLLQFNSQLGVPCLVDAVTQDEDYAGLVAEHLAKAGIDQAIEPIIKRLRNCELKQVDLVVSLLDALAKLGGALPSDLRQRLSEESLKKAALHQALINSGLVKQIKHPAYEAIAEIQLIQVEGKPVSETIIEERR